MTSDALLRARLLTAGLRQPKVALSQYAGSTPSNTHRWIMALAIIAAAMLVGYGGMLLPWLRSIILFSVVGVVFLWLLRLILKAKKCRTALLEFERDYPAFLMSVASRVKTGMEPFEALLQGAEGLDPRSLLSLALRQAEEARQRTGSEQAAILRLVQHIPHGDVPLLVDSLRIARITGAAISATLYRLAKVTRARQSFRRKANAAVAMQRLSTYGILGCCVALLGVQSIALPGAISQVFAVPSLAALFLAGIGCLLCGSWWMLWLTRVRVG